MTRRALPQDAVVTLGQKYLGDSAEPLLKVRNLRTVYRTDRGIARAVDGVSFDITSGKIVGLVGETGCGKSQTALSIMRLIEPPGQILPDSEISFAGTDLMALRETEMLHVRGGHVSMIFQEPRSSLNPFYSVGSHLREALRLHGVHGADEIHQRSVEALATVGVADPVMRLASFPHELSGGICQRVMIAIALICEPRLLIADEPTTALDVTIQAQILDVLRNACDQLGMSVLLITHDLGVIGEIADEVLVMYAGRIVERVQDDVLSHPAHPYTRGLMAAAPHLDNREVGELHVIPGSPPSPAALPTGCRFAPRCEFVFEQCTTYPPFVRMDDSSVACWLYSKSTHEEGGADSGS